MKIPILLLSFVLAFLSLLYELLIAQTMGFLTANAAAWYGITIGVFIGSMGIGAACVGVFPYQRDARGSLAVVESLLAFIGGAAVLLLYQAHALALFLEGNEQVALGKLVFFFSGIVTAAAVGLLTGFEVPILLEMGRSDPARRISAEKVLAADYIGALTAGCLFPLVLLPHLGLLRIGAGAAVVTGFVALGLAQRSKEEDRPLFLTVGFLLLAAFSLIFVLGSRIETAQAKGYYFSGSASWTPQAGSVSLGSGRVHRDRSPYQVIDRVDFPGGQDPDLAEMVRSYLLRPDQQHALSGWGLFLNGDFQFSADTEALYHEVFAHVPLAASGLSPRRVLVLGGGDGLLVRELLKVPSVEEVVLVDIDPVVVSLFRKDPVLRALNRDALGDPRVRVIVGDAYDFVRRNHEKYDAVYLDFPAPSDYDQSKLYSQEFYTFLKDRLGPQGVVALGVPGLFPVNDEAWGGREMSLWSDYAAPLRAGGFVRLVPFFSRLEEDNAQALAVMRRLYKGAEGMVRRDVSPDGREVRAVEIRGEENVAREMLKEHVRKMTAGFILAVPDDRVLPLEEGRLRTEGLDVLDQRRFLLSLKAGEGFDEGAGRVNSVFRPVIAGKEGVLEIRSPY
ncbi:MAG: hypothetical protein GX606_06795 [Elusimicrobia bacterium]|nr:hypothetical protein [Elusimicrobiota bacterium]